MNDEIRIPIQLPLDSDGFLRRECPSCNREFKWFSHPEGSDDAEVVEQYFCPLCGNGSGVDTWWTLAQLEHIERAGAPAIDRMLAESLESAFKGVKGMEFKANSEFSRGVPAPEPLEEPDDMVAVEPPCHPNEPVKVPEDATSRVHCLICGQAFAA